MIELIKNKINYYSFEAKSSIDDMSFLLSLSGGMDSIVLAKIMIELKKTLGFKISFVHMNHHSHDQSKNISEFVKKFSNHHGINLFEEDIYISSEQNFESMAREKRYKIINSILNYGVFSYALTAHHKNDQIETIFMKNEDGADWISMMGIRESLGKIKRPMLEISKDEIRKFAMKHCIKWVEDPSNQNMSFRRNHIRSIKLPMSVFNNPKIINQLLKIHKDSMLKYERICKEFKKNYNKIIIRHEDNCLVISKAKLIQYDLEEIKILFYFYINKLLNTEIQKRSKGLWAQFSKFINQSRTGSIFKIDRLTIINNRNQLIIVKDYNNLKKANRVRLCNDIKWYAGRFKIQRSNQLNASINKTFYTIPKKIYDDGLYIRSWKNGDRMHSATLNQKILISDLYINNKLSIYEKLIQPVVVDKSDEILWIPGLLHGKISLKDSDKKEVINWMQA